MWLLRTWCHWSLPLRGDHFSLVAAANIVSPFTCSRALQHCTQGCCGVLFGWFLGQLVNFFSILRAQVFLQFWQCLRQETFKCCSPAFFSFYPFSFLLEVQRIFSFTSLSLSYPFSLLLLSLFLINSLAHWPTISGRLYLLKEQIDCLSFFIIPVLVR